MSVTNPEHTDTPDEDPTPGESTTTPRMHGLWEFISQPVSESPEPSGELPEEESNADEAPVSAGKSLWAVMHAATASQEHPVTEPAEEVSGRDSQELSEDPAPENPSEPPAVVPHEVAVPLESAVEYVAAASPILNRSREASPSWGDWWGLVLGLLALPLTACAWFPGIVPSLPYSACAFGALGFSASVLLRPGRWSWPQGRAVFGAGCALTALITGPYLISPAGNAHRDRLSVQATQQHLEAIGRGLANHHAEHQHYPIGGTIVSNAAGARRGGHGWMTRLLPYIDRTDVYDRIRLDIPYDDPVNRPVMGTPIETYFAANGDRRNVANGFAVAHFSGVGGEVRTTAGDKLPAGIFDLDRPIRERELLDGLSNTWIVGELPGGYPPWGDPENWRTVTKGINRDSHGFGNATGTGAMLLFADGSVRFASNQTDVDLLRRWSTRAARDLR